MYVYIYIYIYIYVCMYIYIYIYIYLTASKRGQDKRGFGKSAATHRNYGIIMA